MQELNHILYEAFVSKYYTDENKCTHPDIAKTVLFSKNRGFEITMKDGSKFKVITERINS